MTSPDQLEERSRLDLQHQVWLLTLQGRLHTVPLPDHPSSILDIGCGTGVWALAMALAHPTLQVTATDLTLPKDLTPPTNLTFIEADADEKWLLGQFSFIHGRMLTSGIHNWSKFLAQCWEHLEPSGILELLDICHPFRAEDPATNETSSAFIQFGYAAEKAWARSGLDYRASTKHVERLNGLGFINVREEEAKWPLGEWAETEMEREVGKITLGNFQKFLDMAGIHILTSNSGMSEQKARELVTAAQEDLTENAVSKKLYLTIKIHTAQKATTASNDLP